MKPGVFEYVAPTSVDDALRILGERGEDTSMLAGGQSLMPLLNMRLARPEVLMDLNNLSELAHWELTDDTLSVGALVRAAELEEAPAVRAALPVIVSAISHIGHPQIRNRTTIGGNIAHADPSSELPGVLAALDGRVELRSARGSRIVPWSEFFEGVFLTTRQPDEMVTAVHFPRLPGWTLTFREFARRHGDFPLAALTVAIKVEDGVIAGLRVAATGVADRPVRLTPVEEAAVGRRLDASLLAELVPLARDSVNPQPDAAGSSAYRKHLVGTLLARSLDADLARTAA